MILQRLPLQLSVKNLISSWMSSASIMNVVKGVKPPNVLILTPSNDSANLFSKTKEEIQACLGYDRYTIYPLPLSDVTRKPWKDNCILLIAPNLSSPLSSDELKELSSYVESSGRCLSMNINLSTHIADTVTKRCSIQTSMFNDTNDLIHVTPSDSRQKPFFTLKCVCSPTQSLTDDADITWSVIDLAKATESRSETAPSIPDSDPCVWLVTDAAFRRVSIISFLELVVPEVHTPNVSKLGKLKETGESRHDFLRSLFSLLGLECGSPGIPPLSHIYLVTSNPEYRQKYINAVMPKVTKTSNKAEQAMPFTHTCIKGSDSSSLNVYDDYSLGTPVDPPEESTETLVTILTKPSDRQINALDFNSKSFFSHLKTRNLGRSLLIGPVVTSTQSIFTGNVPFTTCFTQENGLVCIAGQQTKGRGRGGNVWISPKGCLMFSLPLKMPVSSRLAKRLSLVQHIMALSVVSAIRTKKGYEEFSIMIKWPNDIYYGKEAKLGGIIATSFTLGQDTTAVIGCGVNVNNQFPTISINDCIRLHNKSHSNQLPLLSLEEILAAILNKLEVYISLYEEWGLSAIEELYYQYWMHRGTTVQVSGHAEINAATITGIDEYGYLRVRTKDGESLSLQPDGNTFDIMRGLIRMK